MTMSCDGPHPQECPVRGLQRRRRQLGRLATLIENCKIAGIKPHTLMTETLTKLVNGHPANTVGDLIPWVNVS